MKFQTLLFTQQCFLVAPVRERGLKSLASTPPAYSPQVAPVRERGLKWSISQYTMQVTFGRSRKGAWIEISSNEEWDKVKSCRSRKGAWIEISVARQSVQ